MAKVLNGQPAHREARDWRRSMSNHVASALIVYTALQIFMTVEALREAAAGSHHAARRRHVSDHAIAIKHQYDIGRSGQQRRHRFRAEAGQRLFRSVEFGHG